VGQQRDEVINQTSNIQLSKHFNIQLDCQKKKKKIQEKHYKEFFKSMIGLTTSFEL
jgi:hypothetical protein